MTHFELFVSAELENQRASMRFCLGQLMMPIDRKSVELDSADFVVPGLGCWCQHFGTGTLQLAEEPD
jgi:hypothetical protein